MMAVDADTEARHQRRRDAAADAIAPHHAVVISDKAWQPKRFTPPVAPSEKLPTGVSYVRSNGNGTGLRQRPYMVVVYEKQRSIPLGYFADSETASRFRSWALDRKAAGEHWKLTLDERQEWERRITVSETPPPNPEIGDIWVRP